jgi:hypothetical protein
MISVHGMTPEALAVKGDAMEASPGFSIGMPSAAMASASMLSIHLAHFSMAGVMGLPAALACSIIKVPFPFLITGRRNMMGQATIERFSVKATKPYQTARLMLFGCDQHWQVHSVVWM